MDVGATVGDDGGGGELTVDGTVPELPVSGSDGGRHGFRSNRDRSVIGPNSAAEPTAQPAVPSAQLSTPEQIHVTGVRVGDGA